MAHILASLTRALLRDEQREPEVHFHAAGGGAHEVCYDARCGRPHLSV